MNKVIASFLIKIKQMKKSIILIMVLITIISCSKELSLEEKIEGQWYGLWDQLDCCNLEVDVNIAQLIENQPSATGTMTIRNSVALCDDSYFDCEGLKSNPSVSFNWIFSSNANDVISLDHKPLDYAVFVDAFITLRLVDDNTINAIWVDKNDITNRATGMLTRK
jgi:hypothetical protein